MDGPNLQPLNGWTQLSGFSCAFFLLYLLFILHIFHMAKEFLFLPHIKQNDLLIYLYSFLFYCTWLISYINYLEKRDKRHFFKIKINHLILIIYLNF